MALSIDDISLPLLKYAELHNFKMFVVIAWSFDISPAMTLNDTSGSLTILRILPATSGIDGSWSRLFIID